MSADWKAGDKALCVDGRSSAWEDIATRPTKGTIYLVRDVLIGYSPDMVAGVCLRVGLIGEEVGGWCATRFRKIVPACDRVEVEQEEEA